MHDALDASVQAWGKQVTVAIGAWTLSSPSGVRLNRISLIRWLWPRVCAVDSGRAGYLGNVQFGTGYYDFLRRIELDACAAREASQIWSRSCNFAVCSSLARLYVSMTWVPTGSLRSR